MTSEMSEKSYQAVRCLYCSKPIRLSPRLLELCRADSDGIADEKLSKSQVFILRCGNCSKEIRYLKSEIETLGGESLQASAAIRSTPHGYIKPLAKAAGQ